MRKSTTIKIKCWWPSKWNKCWWLSKGVMVDDRKKYGRKMSTTSIICVASWCVYMYQSNMFSICSEWLNLSWVKISIFSAFFYKITVLLFLGIENMIYYVKTSTVKHLCWYYYLIYFFLFQILNTLLVKTMKKQGELVFL